MCPIEDPKYSFGAPVLYMTLPFYATSYLYFTNSYRGMKDKVSRKLMNVEHFYGVG